MELNKRFIVDLSQAKTPADIVFEISNVLENPDAANRKIWLKLGDVALNQSQILSIKSLISSINSTLSLIESECSQTELAAATLGINTKDVEEELQAELSALEPETPKDSPSQQYIPLEDYKDENETEQKSEETSSAQASDALQEETEQENSQQSSQTPNSDRLTDNVTTNSDENADLQEENQSEAQDKHQSYPESEIPASAIEEHSEEEKQEIQTQLDSIFDSEVKLENILSEDKDITAMQNWPLTKESGVDDIEIPEEVMTDEDYEILQMNTQYHKQTVRSGQVIQSNGNVVIIGDCHPGCEIHAAGDITVWGVLGGIAHAGCKGNTKARIRALTLNAIQLRIAESYARRPDHIKNIYVEKSNTFTPEEARYVNGCIVILKTNDK